MNVYVSAWELYAQCSMTTYFSARLFDMIYLLNHKIRAEIALLPLILLSLKESFALQKVIGPRTTCPATHACRMLHY